VGVELPPLSTMSSTLDTPPGGGYSGLPAKPLADYDWKAGLTFTPAKPGPKHLADGEPYNIGTILLRDAMMVPGISLEDTYQQDVVHLGGTANGALYLELPPEPATYLVSLRLVDAAGRPIAAFCDPKNPLIVGGCGSGVGATNPLSWAPLSDGTGLVAVCKITPQPYTGTGNKEVSQYWGMRTYNAVVTFGFPKGLPQAHTYHPTTIIFGGFTVARL
jgi:hypothetical protein